MRKFKEKTTYKLKEIVPGGILEAKETAVYLMGFKEYSVNRRVYNRIKRFERWYNKRKPTFTDVFGNFYKEDYKYLYYGSKGDVVGGSNINDGPACYCDDLGDSIDAKILRDYEARFMASEFQKSINQMSLKGQKIIEGVAKRLSNIKIMLDNLE